MDNLYGYNIGSIPGQDLMKVKGIESAKMFPTRPNTRTAVFDENDDVFYVISTDAWNYKTIQRFRFVEEPLEVANESKFATKEEFNTLKEMINNVQHSIQQLSNKSQYSGKPNKQRSNSGRENEANGVDV
jgi:hypothetical protein